MASAFLDQYDSLDVIGNGAFGIIRKVRRKTDGSIYARKELNFEKMSERDRKQIVAEVNILKELNHDHIVRYHDRYVDRDAGILYILMEYCGGGDLSTVITQAQRHNRPIPEDTIWNYFMQILLALQHCHHPSGHGRNGSGGTGATGEFESNGSGSGKERRTQVLHRDLKPDNVFLDENNTVKLGDFGLSKALVQTSFANTYVGTPYYMSPELMQEKAYDSKSDIWSLGCLIFELCALKPPFHEARTHTELSMLIRNGRIPPLPKGYSQSLNGVIKAMLNQNPAMRPSAVQLLQHERLELVFKVSETEKMLATVKAHKNTILAREREVASREASLAERDQHLTSIVAQKDAELASLQQTVAHLQFSQQDLENAVREAIARREEELRVLVLQREEEVAAAIAKREEEIIQSVNKREAELNEAWVVREEQIRQEVDERVQWVQDREAELAEEETRLEGVKRDLEEKMKKWEAKSSKGRKEKAPLEEVKNLLEPFTRLSPPQNDSIPLNGNPTPQSKPRSPSPFPGMATPMSRAIGRLNATPVSAMKGVVLTATGEVLATPAPGDLAKLFVESPKVGLDFTKIFDPNARNAKERPFGDDEAEDSADEAESPPPSPSCRKEKTRRRANGGEDGFSPKKGSSSSSSSAPLPTRIRRPSIRTSAARPLNGVASISASISDPNNLAAGSTPGSSQSKPLPLPHPHLHSASLAPAPNVRVAGASSRTMQRTNSAPATEYDMANEENLPSPFLKRTERAAATATKSGSIGKRHSNGNLLRAVAAANATVRRGTGSISGLTANEAGALTTPSGAARQSVASARKASEEARKALSRP